MKSLNVKKIATAAAGAALLGAAFAGAVSVDTSGLENFNFFAAGSPQVKIVVGANAAPSDAVAAANIAAMIGNLAYTSEDVTVVGTDLLSCEGGTTTTTTATGSADDKVSLEVTTPGVNPAIAYQMKTYSGISTDAGLGGYLDANTTDDRNNAMTGMSILSTTTPYASAGRKITSSDSTLVWKGTITDSQSSKSYTQEERYYAYAQTLYDTSTKKVKGKSPQVAYEAQFTNPLPVCTYSVPSDTSNTNCNSDTYKTIKHRVKVKLLGTDWVIYGMDSFPNDGTINASTAITLGKEVQYKEFMQIGDEVTAPSGVKVKLKDISAVPTTAAQLLSVSFEIYDKDGKIVDAKTLQQDQEYNNYGVVVRVFQVFAGLGQTSYAQVSIFSDKLTLQHGVSVDTNNQEWKVTLIGGASSYGSSLARVQLTRQVVDDLNPADSVSFLKKPALMKMSYNGLEDVTYDTLSFTTSERGFPVSSTDTTTTGLSYVRVTSGLISPFDFGAASANTFYYITDATGAGNATKGTLFYQDASTSNFVPYYDTAGTNHTVNYTTALTGFGFSARTGVVVWNLSAQCPTFTVANLTNATSLATNTSLAITGLTLGAAGGVNPGRLTASGFIASGATVNLTISAATANAGCTGGNFIYDFQNSNATFVPAIGTTGVTGDAKVNYVKYTYGSNFVNLGFSSPGITAGAADPTAANGYVMFVPEYIKDDDTTQGAFMLDVGYGDQTTPRLVPSGATATAAYNAVYNATAFAYHPALAGTTYEAGFVSPRGSKLDSISLNSATLKYATTLAHALYTLSAAGTETTGNTATTDYKAGATALDSNGYKVIVKAITAKGGGEAAKTTGATLKGTENLKPSTDTAFVITPLDTASSPIVVTDAQASATQPLIVVGGPLINSVAAQALAGSPAPTASMEPVVTAQGDKLLVYGYTAADTQAAADELISWLAANAATVTGK